jgi:hypothetical protein
VVAIAAAAKTLMTWLPTGQMQPPTEWTHAMKKKKLKKMNQKMLTSTALL